MTEQLQYAVNAAQQLSADDQNAIAARILREIEDLEWERLLATPESDAFLDRLEEEALREYQEGRTEEGGFGKI
jgi:hypothetical protein